MTSHRRRRQVLWLGPTVFIATSLTLLIASEILLRLIVGHPLIPVQIAGYNLAGAGSTRDMIPFVDAGPNEFGTQREWINQGPPPLPGRDEPDAELLKWQKTAHDSGWKGLKVNLYRQWNAEWMRRYGCEPGSPIEAIPIPVHEFDAPNDSLVPMFRYLPGRTTPLGMRTNRFAWRGPELPLDKPPGTVRLAFVGASTTVGTFSCATSYPEYVIHWLNLWAESEGLDVRFDGINAGREGMTSRNIAAIVRSEILPMEPDLIFYYEGVNQLRRWISHEESLGDIPRQTPPKTSLARRILIDATGYSLLAGRLQFFLSGLDRTGLESVKPPHEISWPTGVSESDPDPFDPELPFGLAIIMQDLDSIVRMAAAHGSELALASFVFLVEEDMKLDRWKGSRIENFYNTTLWPLTYAEIRRVADFENRVFHSYARKRIVAFVDLAEHYPQDQTLFMDGVHFTCDGIRLQAWIVFQKLLRLVRSRIEDGQWPSPDQEPLTTHPGIAPPRLIEDRCVESSEATSSLDRNLGATDPEHSIE